MTRAVVVLRETGLADLIDQDTSEVIIAGGDVAEMQTRAGRVREIHERHARIRGIISQAGGNLTRDEAAAIDAGNDRFEAA